MFYAYFPISDITIGECLQLSDGSSVALTKAERTEAQKVYNLDVWRGESFLVGESELVADPVCSQGFKNYMDKVKSTVKGEYDKLINNPNLIAIRTLPVHSVDNINIIQRIRSKFKDLNINIDGSFGFGRIISSEYPDLEIGYIIAASSEASANNSVLKTTFKNIIEKKYGIGKSPNVSVAKNYDETIIQGLDSYKPSPKKCDAFGNENPVNNNGTPTKVWTRTNDGDRKIILEFREKIIDYCTKKNIAKIDLKFKINLALELHPCPSCTKIINDFLEEFPNASIEIYTNTY